MGGGGGGGIVWAEEARSFVGGGDAVVRRQRCVKGTPGHVVDRQRRRSTVSVGLLTAQ